MSFLSDYETLAFSDLQVYVERGQEEHLHLDFKSVKDADMSFRDDRKNLACALSGFANSGGGLVVWGVDGRRNSDGVDCAVGLKSIDKVAILINQLNSYTGEGTDPIVDGVLHRAIETKDGCGFALTLIPESDRGPHMAKLGENRYYKRSGDSFYVMEHFDIADMFGRRKKPRLSIFYKVIRKSFEARVHIGLRNSGRATARAPFLAFETDGPLHRARWGLDGNGNDGLTQMVANSGLRWAYGGGMDFALHPEMDHEVAALSLPDSSRFSAASDLVVRYAIACEDQPLERGKLVIPYSELQWPTA